MRYRLITSTCAGIALSILLSGSALATPSPNGPGQPGAPGTTCGNTNTLVTPGQAVSAGGSPFNSTGTAGQNYAGNPGTASAAHANSTHAVSQYDIACFQVTSH
jgi:hypothetical protein